MTTNDRLNNFLKNERIDLPRYKDLKLVTEVCDEEGLGTEKLHKILSWFLFLQSSEIVGWRPKELTRKITHLLIENSRENTLVLYSLFCPSYRKGVDSFGFRVDGVGETTRKGISRLEKFYRKTLELGFEIESPVAIFFDLAIEQYEKVTKNNSLCEIEKNISNFKNELPKNFRFHRLSDFRIFKENIGYRGIYKKDVEDIPLDTFFRIIERGKKFYKLFGWTDEQITERSKIIAASEAFVGKELRKIFPNGIMIYTPTMLERAAVYSGHDFKNNPLPIIFPKD